MTARPIAVSLGCPSGVGPEVSVVAARSMARHRILLIGDSGVVRRAARVRGIDPDRFVLVPRPGDVERLARGRVGVFQPTASLGEEDVRYGAPSRASGAAELAWVETACDLARRGQARAMVTGPVSKDAIVRSGAKGAKGFTGHTEHLQRRLRAREVVMAFWTAPLTIALVTTHIAFRDVPRLLTRAGVARAVYWLADLLSRVRRRRVARIAVAALNPHAGEGGLFGDEEPRIVTPGIALARQRLRKAGVRADVVGPVPAETVFRVAADRYDGIVALYHDQATIPMKILGFGEAVNVSLGLPIVRTSVDHGTAYDVAGRGVADARGMLSAMELAVRLSAST
jgi:4-hydroxythreonine-4-phosphate dehydrogenase